MNSKKWIVYLYVCKINNKKYVGKTCNKYGMKGRAKNGKGYRRGVFHNAIEKYGWNNFAGEILKENLTNEEANYWETYYIRKYRTCIDYKDCNGYNMTEGGDGGEMLGYHHTDETKTKISNAFKGRFVGELNPMYGVHDNHICNEDGHLPKEIREKLSKSAKRRMKNDKEWADKMQSYNEARKRAVNQYDIYGNFICQYESINSLKQIYGNCTSIWKVCKRYVGKKGDHLYTAYGYQWRYADDCNDIGELNIPKKDTSYMIKNLFGAIKIVQYKIDGTKINTYESASEASRITGICRSGIGKCCKGKQKTAGGYIWRYADEVENNTLEAV